MKTLVRRWTPAVLLGVGALVTVGMDTQRSMPLRAPLDAVVPDTLLGYIGSDGEISDQELQVVGVNDYLYRVFEPARATTPAAPSEGPADPAGAIAGAGTRTAAFSLYVGFYERQFRGRTIHSPKNCLPGAGWEALTSTTREITVGGRTVTVNQYLLKRDEQRAMVLYWYQGRGRVEANEYRVKFDLLRDSALLGRSDEALVRLVVPVTTTEEEAAEIAEDAAGRVIPAVDRALPA
jgi:EpsI family protein